MLHDLPDVTIAATSVAQALSPGVSIKCNWFQVQVKTAAGTIRIGSSLISTSRGGIVSSSQFAPPRSDLSAVYDLSTVYVLGTQNDVLAVLYNV